MPTTKPKSWRDIVKVHPAAELLPMVSGAELRELSEDIKKHGLREPVVIQSTREGPVLIDGRNRLAAMELAGLPIFTKAGAFRMGVSCSVPLGIPSHAKIVDYVISANLHRRHLSPEQKRELIKKLLKAQPEKSNRAIAKQAKVDHKTVAAARKDAEATGEIPHKTERQEETGRKARGRKPDAPKPKATSDIGPTNSELKIDPISKARLDILATEIREQLTASEQTRDTPKEWEHRRRAGVALVEAKAIIDGGGLTEDQTAITLHLAWHLADMLHRDGSAAVARLAVERMTSDELGAFREWLAGYAQSATEAEAPVPVKHDFTDADEYQIAKQLPKLRRKIANWEEQYRRQWQGVAFDTKRICAEVVRRLAVEYAAKPATEPEAPVPAEDTPKANKAAPAAPPAAAKARDKQVAGAARAGPAVGEQVADVPAVEAQASTPAGSLIAQYEAANETTCSGIYKWVMYDAAHGRDPDAGSLDEEGFARDYRAAPVSEQKAFRAYLMTVPRKAA